MPPRLRRIIAAAALGLACASEARAQSVQGGVGDTQEPPPPGVFDAFDHLRARAADAGATLGVRYTSETGFNPAGGNAERIAETGQLDFNAKLDLEKLAGVKGGSFQTVVTWRRGDLLDDVAHLGTLEQSQEVYGRGQTWRLTRFWYEQQLGRASVKLGRAGVGEDFDKFSCDFMNLTFCSSQPGSIVGNYWYDFPVSQWAGRLKLKVRDGFLQVGAYEINLRTLDRSFTIGHFSGATGVMVPIEAAWTPKHRGLLGTYRIGGWYDSSRGDDVVLDTNGGLVALTGGAPLQRHGRWGTWFLARQQLTGAAKDGKATRGLTLFARGAQADKRTATTDNQLTIGLFYEGVDGIAKDDAIGVALGRTHVNARVTGAERVEPDKAVQHSEYVGELFYSLHPVSGIVLRPNVQYIVNPGGRHGRDAAVLGLKAVLTL